MADNFNEQELQALFRRHLPYRQMPPEFAERLKQQVLAEVANTLQSSTLTAAVKDEARLGAQPTVGERPLQTYVRQPAKSRAEPKGGMLDWLQQRLRLAPSLTLAGATLAAILAFVVWGPMLIDRLEQRPGTGSPSVITPGDPPADDVASALTPTATEAALVIGAGEVVSATVTPSATSMPTSETVQDAPLTTATAAAVVANEAGNGTVATVATAAADNGDENATATPYSSTAGGVDDVTPVITPSKTNSGATATTQSTLSPTRTPDPSHSATPTSATRTPTRAPSRTPEANGATPTVGGSPVPTKTTAPNGASGEDSPFNTPTVTSTPRPIVDTPADIPAPTKSPTPPPLGFFTVVPSPSPTATVTRTPTATHTPAQAILQPIATATATVTNTPTNTPVPPTATATVTNTPTNTPVPPTATPTNTPVPPTATATDTEVPPTATATNTAVPPTATATNTAVPPTATPINRSPIVSEIRVDVPEDTSRSISLLSSIKDEDGDDLRILSVLSGPNGSAVLQDGGVVFYTPAAQFFGNDTFTFEVTDGQVTITGKVDVNVIAVNQPPTFTRSAFENAVATMHYEQSVLATDADQTDNLVIRAITSELLPWPSWLRLEPVSNGHALLSGDPTANDVGEVTIKLEVVDGAGGRDEWEFKINVEAPPGDPLGAGDNVFDAGAGDVPALPATETPMPTPVP